MKRTAIPVLAILILIAASTAIARADTLWVADGNRIFDYMSPSAYLAGSALWDAAASDSDGWQRSAYLVDATYFDPTVWGWDTPFFVTVAGLVFVPRRRKEVSAA
jgi:hypothetical protein